MIHKAHWSKGETLPEGITERDGLILVSLARKMVAVALCGDYPPGMQLYHSMMAGELGWSSAEHDVAVRVVVPPGDERCYSFASVYTGVGATERPGILDTDIDRKAAKNFKRAAWAMLAVGLPNLPVIWEVTDLQRHRSGDLKSWGG